MPTEFIGKEIQVRVSDDMVRRPLTFKLARREHQVTQILGQWQDHGFVRIRPSPTRDFRQQRQYYRVRTEDGDIWEIYVDWLAGRQRKDRPEKARWYAYRRIYGAAAAEEEAEAL